MKKSRAGAANCGLGGKEAVEQILFDAPSTYSGFSASNIEMTHNGSIALGRLSVEDTSYFRNERVPQFLSNGYCCDGTETDGSQEASLNSYASVALLSL